MVGRAGGLGRRARHDRRGSRAGDHATRHAGHRRRPGSRGVSHRPAHRPERWLLYTPDGGGEGDRGGSRERPHLQKRDRPASN
ncbi:MAG: hypothetical protein DIU82_06150, partial [Bacillota bacterium]